ncbi:MAG: DUF5134 domain-containing protein [Acidimicrobiales bacterium]
MGMTMAMVPRWLYDLFAVLMLCVAAYSATLLAVAAWSRRTRGWDVELSHLLMGVAMAGMFVTGWSFLPSEVWQLCFGALLVWFVVRSGRSVLAYGAHLPHTAVHALMSLAMLVMYWLPMGASGGSMSMSPVATARRADPGLVLVMAFMFVVSAVFTLASEHKGHSVYGTHGAPNVTKRTVAALVGVPGGVGPSSTAPAATTPSAGGLEGLVTKPWLLDTPHVVMSIAMGFMLVFML